MEVEIDTETQVDDEGGGRINRFIALVGWTLNPSTSPLWCFRRCGPVPSNFPLLPDPLLIPPCAAQFLFPCSSMLLCWRRSVEAFVHQSALSRTIGPRCAVWADVFASDGWGSIHPIIQDGGIPITRPIPGRHINAGSAITVGWPTR